MPTYLSPGVYVEEVPAGVRTIEGVGTSTAAFVGMAERGVVDTPFLVTNFTQFVNEFGRFLPNSYLAYAVFSFFAEGGSRCYVVRVTEDGAQKGSASFTSSDGTSASFELTARSEGEWGNRLYYEISAPSVANASTHFKLTIKYVESFTQEYPGEVENILEVFDNVSASTLEEKINGISAFVNVTFVPTDPSMGTSEYNSTNRPSNTTGTWTQFLDGSEGTAGTIDYIGKGDNTGLYSFETVDNINIVAIPDIAGNRNAILDAINYCEGRGDCIFLVDPPVDIIPTNVKAFKQGTGSYTGNGFNSSYAAMYYPWVYINDPLTRKTKSIPPSGVVAGTFANTDATRGIHKAPAGVSDGYLNSVVGIERQVTRGEQDDLNPLGINVIRTFPNAGIVIWGARTLSSNTEWTYVNVRRLMLYIKESIEQGTQFVVFEPNDPALWGRVRRTINAFLSRVWRDGALFGTTQDEAFFVKVDEENNPPAVRDAGQLIIEIGVAPVKPAEFVILRISQKTQSA